MKISSPDFEHMRYIPRKITCDGKDVNPILVIEEIPHNTKTLALIVDDPDAPGKTWVHWVVYNIPLQNIIEEDSVPGTEGINDFQRTRFGGPCPPSGTHRYFFKLYALDRVLSLQQGASKEMLEQAMKGHILEQAEIIGLYKR
ncbi:MAG: YbhB/YbcL family Raf kinase inhibitor-like protein [Parachlamydiales bacterium]|nr:YbhB/YbcL family Raf kinase inhibitor-like protein [Parachlamydiales bacterium]